MRVSAIILARGGSKGVPKKNIIDFCGKPLLAWTIEQCINAQGVDDVWVSSDSKKILEIGHRYGAKSILRPGNISGDQATSESGWLHALDQIEHETSTVDLVVAAQVTSPIRESSDISSALEDVKLKGLDSLLSVNEISDFFIWELNDEKSPLSVTYDYKNRKRRQLIEKRFLENGSFYIFSPKILRKYHNRLGGKIGFKTMETYKMFEIDDLPDLRLCEVIMRGYQLDKT
jgi:CMP-N,N'-diacetyllegionaminic acid synthase